MRIRIACAMLAFATTVGAQTARVSGRIVEEGRGTPVVNATVRLSGSPDQVTDSLGRFEFTNVFPRRYIVTVASIGYRFKTVETTIERDTTLLIAMTRRVATLDTMVVRPRYVRVRGTAVDSATGDALMQAQAILYPDHEFVGAVSGTFRFDSVAPGPVTIIVEAAEHLPVRVELDLSRDTSFRVKMGVDSIALRMIALQVMRLEKRAQAVPFTMHSYNRAAIMEHPVMSMGEFVARKTFQKYDPRRPVRSALDTCYFIDDNRVMREVLEAMLPELIERIEIYAKGNMIRVYTKRYVSSLISQQGIGKVAYVPTSTRTTCA
jgi:hypothetical protein